MLLNYELSLVSFIGIILLMGIVKKNAIMMIDFALDAERTENLTPEEAIYEACVIRFRPIMMTTWLRCSVHPTGDRLRHRLGTAPPLGIAVVGGLILSQSTYALHNASNLSPFEHLRMRFAQNPP